MHFTGVSFFILHIMQFLDLIDIEKKLGNEWNLKKISFTQKAFGRIAITGETGSGKSTLLKIIAGLEQADAGTVLFENQVVKGPLFTLIPGHPGIAYLSQYSELRNNYRIEELLEYATKIPIALAEEIFEVCRIQHLLKRKNDQISGGEKQRIALARLLVGSPRLLLLDEPYSNLDPIHKRILKAVLADLNRRLKISTILSSHDPEDSLEWAEQVLVLQNGKLVQSGKPEEIYHFPCSQYVAGIFGDFNLFEEKELSNFPEVFTKGKELFIRPEEILPANRDTAILEAMVISQKFMGSHYVFEAALHNGKKIRFNGRLQDFHPGEKASLAFQKQQHWFI
ncbi:MAG: hypothetical protein RLZZ28_558 [Bacteroidota bacterium]|jgi:ABC-type sugar transport system ATPase subunit